MKLFLGLTLTTFLITPVFAQDETTVAGRVVDGTGGVLVGADVRLEGDRNGAPLTTTTDGHGRFRFERVAAGLHRLTVRAPGFRPASRTLNPDQRGLVEIRLEPSGFREEITVATTATENEIDRVPGEVTVIDRETFDRVQARSLDDVLRYEPGVNMDAGARRLGQTINIRGFDATRVLVLKDGGRISQFSSGHKGNLFIDVEDIERVEVVRGPASALYGSGALGGVVSIQTRNPVDLLAPGRKVGGGLRLGYSSAYDEWTTTPRLFGAAADGKLGWLTSYTARRNDGIVKLASPDVKELAQAEENVDDINVRLVWAPSAADLLRVSFESYDNDGRTSSNLSNIEVSESALIDRLTDRNTFNLAYRHTGQSWWSEGLALSFDVSNLNIEEERVSDERFDGIAFDTWDADLRNTTWFGGSRHRLTYGVEIVRDEQDARRNDDDSLFFPNGSQTQTGLYLQDEIRLLDDRIMVVPGLRWDRWSTTPTDPSLATADDDRLNPKLGATAEIVDGLVLAANYAEGFRVPRFQELFIGGTHFAFPLPGGTFFVANFGPNVELRPETSRSSDVGIRYRRGGVSARASYYHSSVDNFIEFEGSRPIPDGETLVQTFTSRNVQEATLDGFEAALGWELGSSWSAHASYAAPRGEDTATGEPLVSIPADKLTLGVQWKQEAWGLSIGAASRIHADRDRVPEDVDPTEGFTLVDVNASWRPWFHSNLVLNLAIDNLTNEDYEIAIFGMPGAARDVRVGLTYNFGS